MAVVAGGVVPRRICPDCHREVAIPGGRFARHDPPDRGPALVSCPGSLKVAPMFWRSPGPAGAVPLPFDLVDDPEEVPLELADGNEA